MLSLQVSAGIQVSYKQLRSQYFDSIQMLTTCGDWKIKNKSGKFRVMTVYLYGQNMLFVDMVYPNKRATRLLLEHGFSFKETNDDHAEVDVDSVGCKQQGKNKILLKVSATSGHSGKKLVFWLLVDGNSKTYRSFDKKP
jgi:hypothetical protein